MAVTQVRVKKADWEAKKEFQCAAEHPAGNAEAKPVKPDPPGKILRSNIFFWGGGDLGKLYLVPLEMIGSE